MRLEKVKKILLVFFLVQVCFCYAGIMRDFKDGKFSGLDMAADHHEYIGKNLIAKGNVVVRQGEMLMTADKAIINYELEDMELIGNVTLTVESTVQKSVTMAEYKELLRNPYIRVETLQPVTEFSGAKKINVAVTSRKMYMEAERLAGNLNTGLLQFRNFKLQSGILYCSGERAERSFDGEIKVYDAKMSSCNYLEDDHDHYAIFTKYATIYPSRTESGLYNYNSSMGEHTVWALNNFVEIFGVPLLWLPVVHKPRDWNAFGARLEFGESDEFGFYIRSAKSFQILEEPYLNSNIMLDYYARRGFGYGVDVDFLTPESSTEFMFYGISDKDRYHEWKHDSDFDERRYPTKTRFEIPNYRYEFRISNLTHLTPRLDFRGQVDKISDFDFLEKFFPKRYNSDMEPATFASLEYQGNRYTASAYATFRVNDFFTTVQRLPELRIDFHRQELFGGLYHQGQISMDYLNMKWRKFDIDPKDTIFRDNKDYSTARFDYLHMFYYPLKFFNINFIPRAGFRITAYSDTSDKRVKDEDLATMFVADMIDNTSPIYAAQYDSKGGSKVRFVGELGMEVNTKFYRTWQNVRNAYWELDGLRHVMQPYVNYTYITRPNVGRDHLYYFDEIDRISEQNFVRLGLINRLQTRRGNQVQQILSLENFWDYFFYREDDFNSIGDFGTILSLTPGHGLTFTSMLLLDTGRNSDHDTHVERSGRDAGRPGLNCDLINRWENTLSWEFAPKWRITGNYKYCDVYSHRAPYSMGTTFTTVSSSAMFLSMEERSQTIGASLQFPLPLESIAKIFINYDIDAGVISDTGIEFKKNFHCVDLSFAFGQKQSRDSDGRDRDYYFSFFVSLAGLSQAGNGYKLERD